MANLTKILGMILLLCLTFLKGNGQGCQDNFKSFFSASKENRKINWEQFGDIQLPFTMVYGGPHFDSNIHKTFKHGFTHLSEYNTFSFIAPSQRALIYYGVAFPGQNQPWENIRSPWGNNAEVYNQKWIQDHSNFADGLLEKTGKIEADIMLFDIERQWRTDFDILQLKNDPSIGKEYSSLSNADFLATYKKDLKEWYTKPLRKFRELGYSPSTKVSSYSDAPIWNVFANISGFTWNEWQNSSAPLNYLLQNDEGKVGGSFEQELDFMTPSAYYYYDYPHPFAGEYLSYLLFQIEANKARTRKKVIPFVWLRYSFTPEFRNNFIRPWMAEATAIFPFFSGADGLWLWENPFAFSNDENFSTYEYFLKGLKRLSEYKTMFTGDYKLIIEESARDLNEKKKPVWRGVVKDNLFLVAAHNPFAKDENEKSTILVKYQNFVKSVQLTGYETALCLYDLNVLGVDEQNTMEVNLFPNPSSEKVVVKFYSNSRESLEIKIHDMKGVMVYHKTFFPTLGENFFDINITDQMHNTLVISALQGKKTVSQKVVVK